VALVVMVRVPFLPSFWCRRGAASRRGPPLLAGQRSELCFKLIECPVQSAESLF
jgi:hypothetical protein